MTDLVENTEAPTTDNQDSVENAPTETSFIEQISDPELKSYVEKAGYKDIAGLAKSAMHLEKKLGAPKEPEKYEADQYTYELPENYEANNNLLDPVKEKAIELGIKPEAFKELVKTFTGKESELLQQMNADKETQIKEMQSTLKKEWGNAYEDNLKLADRTWQSFANETDDKVLESLPPEARLAVARVMANVGSKVSEAGVGKTSIDPVSAKSELDNIYSDMNHPYWNKTHSDHNKAVIRVQELSKQIS